MAKRSTTGLAWGEGSISERGGRFQVRWSETAANGSTKRRARTFADRDAAEDHLRLMLRGRRDGAYKPPSELTVAEIVADWLDRGETRWKPATFAAYRQRARTHVLPAMGALRAETLTTPRIQHWIDRMMKAGLDASTVDGAARVLGGALREALQIGIIASNPAAAVRKPSIKLKEIRTWTAADVAAVATQLRGEPMWSALYRVAITTGMRPGELRALRWSDLDLERGIVAIRRTITRDANNLVVMGTDTKTGRGRSVALPPSATKALAVWRTAQKARQLATGPDWPRDPIVFDRGDGTWLPLTTWQAKHARLCEAAGVPRITLHGLRHSNATIELEAGTHPKIISERLGHRTIQTTLDRYSHVSIDLQRAAADALDARLFQGDEDDSDATTSRRN